MSTEVKQRSVAEADKFVNGLDDLVTTFIRYVDSLSSAHEQKYAMFALREIADAQFPLNRFLDQLSVPEMCHGIELAVSWKASGRSCVAKGGEKP